MHMAAPTFIQPHPRPCPRFSSLEFHADDRQCGKANTCTGTMDTSTLSSIDAVACADALLSLRALRAILHQNKF